MRQQEGLSYGVGADVSLSERDEQGGVTAYAIYNPSVRDKLSGSIAEEFRRIATEGFTDSEINNAKAAILEETRLSYSSDAGLAGVLLSQADLGRTFAYQQQRMERLQAVTPEQAKAAFVKYINPENLVVIQAGTFEQ